MKSSGLKTVYYHASCPDGTAAAVIVASAVKSAGLELNSNSFIPIQYGSSDLSKLTPSPGQLFVDITPPKERWKEWIGTDVMVLDHHESAREVTEGLSGIYGDSQWSGAKMAYEHFHVPLVGRSPELEYLAELAMIRDTWKKGHEKWREACAQAEALTFLGAKEAISMSLSGSMDIQGIMSIGEFLMRSLDGKIRKYSSGAFHREKNGFKVSFFNCTEKAISESCDHLIENGSDMAVGWFFSVDRDGIPFYSVSLRSNGRVSSRLIAESYGGGGHERAAGFRVSPASGVSPDSITDMILSRF